jgi:uncharacterized NAD-dependent epimerase/dehydratase family protein
MPTQMTLTDWTARRSGAAISIVGTDRRTGKSYKATGVRSIEPKAGKVVATDDAGNELTLQA